MLKFEIRPFGEPLVASSRQRASKEGQPPKKLASARFVLLEDRHANPKQTHSIHTEHRQSCYYFGWEIAVGQRRLLSKCVRIHRRTHGFWVSLSLSRIYVCLLVTRVFTIASASIVIVPVCVCVCVCVWLLFFSIRNCICIPRIHAIGTCLLVLFACAALLSGQIRFEETRIYWANVDVRGACFRHGKPGAGQARCFRA